ncbi:hypothetical protein L596_006395 [Steinernema carpocapsae]|uniref:Uncharacterized protein n=1 Tax=Steinernema carpocapsae TaxID=34508 RepID=A0A4U8VA24_STECR|nr:hypothetical protein L596_006395 [Steinernema carpocapsae]
MVCDPIGCNIQPCSVVKGAAIPGLLFILGKSYNIAQNRHSASACFRGCLERDALAVDAIEEVIRHRLLSKSDILICLEEAAYQSDLNETELKLSEMAILYVDGISTPNNMHSHARAQAVAILEEEEPEEQVDQPEYLES